MNNSEILLSFIIPVYNVEKYLEECVESIRNQMTDACEIILVNDGSTDTSGELCERYGEADKRITVVCQENGGLSSARNSGLSQAHGKYVAFVDSDDRIAPNSVGVILAWIKNHYADMCFLQTVKFYPDGRVVDLGECIEREGVKDKPPREAIQYIAERPKFPGSAWGKLFRRKFLLEKELHFPLDRRFSEDLGFIRDCILAAEKFDVLETPYYEYRQNREGSITNRATEKNFEDLFIFVDESVECLTREKKAVNEECRYAMGFAAYEYSILLLHYGVVVIQDRKQAYKRLKKKRWVLQFARSKQTKVIALLSRIFGIRLTSILIKAYREIAIR